MTFLTQPDYRNPIIENDLFCTLTDLNIDPAPFYELAAQDLLFKYGENALKLAAQIRHDFQKDKNFESAEIWQCIFDVLS